MVKSLIRKVKVGFSFALGSQPLSAKWGFPKIGKINLLWSRKKRVSVNWGNCENVTEMGSDCLEESAKISPKHILTFDTNA